MKNLFFVFGACAMAASLVAPAAAKPTATRSITASANTIQATRVACVPLVVEGGKDGTKRDLSLWEHDALVKQGYEVIGGEAVEQAMGQLGLTPGSKVSQEDLLRIGRKVGADIVIGGDLKIDSKKTWHITGPRARSKVDFRPMCVDVAKRHVFFDPANNVGWSRNSNSGQQAVAWLVSLPVAMFMGGSVSKEEHKALAGIFDGTFAEMKNVQNRQDQIALSH